MEYVNFTTEEKAEMFDEIAACFYQANFGQLSKSDMELMMFRFYIEKLIHNNRFSDGTIDYRKCSDYRISKDLGITQQCVRNLKVKNQLVHPITYDWKAALAKLTENARYDETTRKVTLNIPDPNLYLEIQNFIEEQGAYVEKQLNNKVLQLRAEYYIELIISLEPEDSRKNIIKDLKKNFSGINKSNTVFDEKSIGKSLINAAPDIADFAGTLIGLISPQNQIGIALLKLLANTAAKSI